ncbi:MAG TPA: 5-(carboxyamino)imidazole ribonucleotide synthase [Allosphingosinicella sp.]|nr:5-(carboxyamino)imidazole ribonucleotide synthase [Allosphingosinicella sp.]
MTIPPGSTIGILGGGQLGRMLAIAAAQLGYRAHIYAPDAGGPAADVTAHWTQGEYEDVAALQAFAAGVDALTFEFENIPTAPLATLNGLRPPLRALEIAQDRLEEKRFVTGLGGRPAPFAAVDDRAGLDAALAEIGAPAVLKTRRFGYDGKGQARIMAPDDADAAWDAVRGAPCVLEGFVRFDAEFSVLLCRGADGEIALWDSPRNVHKDGILDTSIVPAGPELDGAVAKGRALAQAIAAALDYVGVLAVEFFALGEEAIFNEMAPRVHNSGHWTIEGATASQFENHIRAVCGLPLGDTGLVTAGAEMTNLIGADADRWAALLAEPGAHLHLYGKGEARPGRKMGHVIRLRL